MKINILAIFFIGLIFPLLLLYSHTNNIFRTLFPGLAMIDICGYYIIGFVTGIASSLLILKTRKSKFGS